MNDTDCPESIVGLDGLIDGVVRAELSVKVADFMVLVDSGEYALSFMRTFPCTVFPASAEGNAHTNVFDVEDIPVYKAFASCVPVIELTTIQFAV